MADTCNTWNSTQVRVCKLPKDHEGKHDFVKPARFGYRLVPCDRPAHSNPHIDNCNLCAPRWGWVEIPERFNTLEEYRIWRADNPVS